MSSREIAEALEAIRALCALVTPLTAELHNKALRLATRYGYHIYDSLILASAIDSDCTVVYSEDMHDGQHIGPVTIRNPFSTRRTR